MLKFYYTREGQSLMEVGGLTSKKTFCLLSVVSEGSVQGMGMGSVFVETQGCLEHSFLDVNRKQYIIRNYV